MTHPQTGRTTRTIVNRLWQRLMGRGIVHPVDAMQTEPWNADLLDYLAADFAEHHYDLKHTLALIASSQAYQSHSQVVTKGIDDHGYTRCVSETACRPCSALEAGCQGWRLSLIHI